MTEEEAKTKWCPQARTGQRWMATSMEVEDLNVVAVNRSNGAEEHCLCIASACMAWRATDNECSPSAPGEPMPPFKPAGYCGLAGKP